MSERRPLAAFAYAAALLLVAFVGSHRLLDGHAVAASTAARTADDDASTDELRLGYFPNVTHAAALVGLHEGIFEEALDGVALEAQAFNAGPEAIQALLSGAIDASYLGPNPAINGFVQSDGDGLRIVSGATAGGAFLVVRDGIESPADLDGATLATPQLGGTQDVALRAWLQEHGYDTTPEGGGDVRVLPQENGQTLDAFEQGTIDGAWLPEPWASRLVLEAGARVLVDERDLWPDGRYVTTHLVVRTAFLEEHPDVVARLLEGQVAANEFVNDHPEEAQAAANDEIEAVTTKRISDEIIAAAWEHLTFTNDPVASSLGAAAAAAHSVDLLDEVNLDGIYDLTLLNDVLADHDLDAVSDELTAAT